MCLVDSGYKVPFIATEVRRYNMCVENVRCVLVIACFRKVANTTESVIMYTNKECKVKWYCIMHACFIAIVT